MGGMLSSSRFGVVEPDRPGKPGVTGVDMPEGSSSTIKRTRWRCSCGKREEGFSTGVSERSPNEVSHLRQFGDEDEDEGRQVNGKVPRIVVRIVC